MPFNLVLYGNSSFMEIIFPYLLTSKVRILITLLYILPIRGLFLLRYSLYKFFLFHRRDLKQEGELESLKLEGDIGGGLVMERYISLPKDNSKVFRIDSAIVARGVGAGSGGFSRSVLSYILLLKTTCRIS